MLCHSLQCYHCLFSLSLPTKLHCYDIIMSAVEIWGQDRGKGRVSGCPTCEQVHFSSEGQCSFFPFAYLLFCLQVSEKSKHILLFFCFFIYIVSDFKIKFKIRLRANAPSLSLSPPYLYSCIVAPRPPCFITRMSTQSLNSRYMNQERVNKVHSLSARVFLEQIRANMSQRCCLAGISD